MRRSIQFGIAMILIFILAFPNSIHAAEIATQTECNGLIAGLPSNAKLLSTYMIVENDDPEGNYTYCVAEYQYDNILEIEHRNNGVLEVTGEVVTTEVWIDPQAVSPLGENEDSSSDVTYSVQFTLRVKYTDTVANGYTYRRMTNVSGSYSITDSQMSVTAQSYTLGQLGSSTSGASYAVNTYPLSYTSTNWTRTVSSSTYPAIRQIADGYQGAKYNYTITRTKSGSSWSGYFNVFTMGS